MNCCAKIPADQAGLRSSQAFRINFSPPLMFRFWVPAGSSYLIANFFFELGPIWEMLFSGN